MNVGITTYIIIYCEENRCYQSFLVAYTIMLVAMMIIMLIILTQNLSEIGLLKITFCSNKCEE